MCKHMVVQLARGRTGIGRWMSNNEYGAEQDRTSRMNSAEMSVEQNGVEAKVGTTDVEKQKENEENGTASAKKKAETEARKGKGKGRADEAKLPAQLRRGRTFLASSNLLHQLNFTRSSPSLL